MTARSSARERILDAAAAVVLKDGAAHMTMDAVAATAHVSKGGLIYHFPSLKSMLEALMERFVKRAEALIAKTEASLPQSPGRAVKAHILAMLALGDEDLQTAQALLAASAREPSLLAPVRTKRREVMEQVVHSVSVPERAIILILATEGLWMSKLLGVCTHDHKERRQIKETLLRLAEEWCRPEGKAGTRDRTPRKRKGGAR